MESPFTKIFKDGAKLVPGPCLLMGLGSLEGLDGQPLCHIRPFNVSEQAVVQGLLVFS